MGSPYGIERVAHHKLLGVISVESTLLICMLIVFCRFVASAYCCWKDCETKVSQLNILTPFSRHW